MVAIFVVLTILCFVSIDAIIQWRKTKAVALARESPLPAQIPKVEKAIPLPAGLFLHHGHTWTEVQPSGLARVGLDALIRMALGRPDGVALRNAGERVRKGEPLLTLKRGKREIRITSPFDGTIEKANQALEHHPEWIEESPYQSGWVYILNPQSLGMDIREMTVASAAKAWLDRELGRFAEWVGHTGSLKPSPALADGGTPIPGVLSFLDDKAWKEFEREFLHLPKAPSPETRQKGDGYASGNSH